jgi:hypothetical protein
VGQWLSNEIPKIIKTFVVAILKNLTPLKNIKEIANNLKNAAKAGYTAYRSSDLSKLLRSGEAAQVVEGVILQIKKDAFTHVAQALEQTFTSLVKMAAPVGQIYEAVKQAFTYIAKIYFHFRDIYKMERIIVEATDLYKTAMKQKKQKKQGGMFKDSILFQEWFQDVIDDMPIVASWVMACPLTGSFTGYLSATSKEGQDLTDNVLADNLKRLDEVKGYAIKYIQESETKIQPKNNNKLIAMSLKIAQGEKISVGSFNKEFKKMQRKEKWNLKDVWTIEEEKLNQAPIGMVPWFSLAW